MTFATAEFRAQYRDNPLRLMVLHLAMRDVHPADISSVTRLHVANISRWCREDEVQLATGVQPVGIEGLIERGVLTIDQLTKFRQDHASDEMISLVHLHKPREADGRRGPVGEYFPADDESLSQPHGDESALVGEFSTDRIIDSMQEVTGVVGSQTIDDLKEELSPKVFKYANGMFDGLNAMLQVVQNPAWLERQRASELANLFQVVSGRASELLGSLSAPNGPEDQESRLPQRAGDGRG